MIGKRKIITRARGQQSAKRMHQSKIAISVFMKKVV
jgi:hypothetical protein